MSSARRLQYAVEDLGRTVAGSKKRITWKFWFEGEEEVCC